MEHVLYLNVLIELTRKIWVLKCMNGSISQFDLSMLSSIRNRAKLPITRFSINTLSTVTISVGSQRLKFKGKILPNPMENWEEQKEHLVDGALFMIMQWFHFWWLIKLTISNKILKNPFLWHEYWPNTMLKLLKTHLKFSLNPWELCFIFLQSAVQSPWFCACNLTFETP